MNTHRHFNPRAPCGARRGYIYKPRRKIIISIHAPRVGRDTSQRTTAARTRYFNPRAPCGARPALAVDSRPTNSDFNPRAPCGARLHAVVKYAPQNAISIHAPRVGRDNDLFYIVVGLAHISIHAPRVGRDLRNAQQRPGHGISIHAPRVGRDSKFDDFTPSNLHKRYKRVLARPKNTREKGKIKKKLAYIHAFSAFLGCEGSGTFCALVLRTQYR